jgi:hypothetical protein
VSGTQGTVAKDPVRSEHVWQESETSGGTNMPIYPGCVSGTIVVVWKLVHLCFGQPRTCLQTTSHTVSTITFNVVCPRNKWNWLTI